MPIHGARRMSHHIVAVVIVALLASPPPTLGATSNVRRLKTELAGIRSDVRAAGREYSRAYWRLDETEVRIAKTDRKIARTRRLLKATRAKLGRSVTSMYRRGGFDPLSALLTSCSFDELLTRLEFLQRIAEREAVTIDAALRLDAQLRSQRAALARERASRTKDAAVLKRRARSLERRLRAKQAKYDSVLAALRREMGADPHYSGLPPGPNGMVFPVAGANYYSDTWGASRSGGRRRHRGTDIMAGRGTPVVACLSGSVTSKSGGLGGKTIWLRANNGWTFYFAHLNGWAVRSGHVSAGQVIGYVGSTGNAQGGSPHLHFEIHPGGGSAVNPYPYLRRMES